MKITEDQFEWKGGGRLVHTPTHDVFFMHDGKLEVSHAKWHGADKPNAGYDMREVLRMAEKIHAEARKAAQK
jgi:hypothetical protein